MAKTILTEVTKLVNTEGNDCAGGAVLSFIMTLNSVHQRHSLNYIIVNDVNEVNASLKNITTK